MNPPDPNITKTVEDLKDGGWIVAVLGALGAFCRLLISDESHHWLVWMRRIVAGAVIGVLGYFAVHGLVPPLYEAVIYSVSGAFSVELVEVVRKRLLKFL